MLLGVILATLLQQYNAYIKTKARGETNMGVTRLEAAFNEFFYQHDRHPCPADPTLTAVDPDYGIEGNCSTATTAEPAIIGMIPFKALNIPENFAYDGWLNRYTYAVTRALTVAPVLPSAVGELGLNIITYDSLSGALSYAPPTDLPATGQYAIISHGDNGAGAYSRHGVINFPCVTGTLTAESENCDGDADFVMPRDGMNFYVTYGDNIDYYDDRVLVVRTIPARIWTASPVNRSDIYTKISRIGIGTDTPDPTVRLDVAGNIRSEDLKAGTVCELSDPLRCFEPDMISGDRNMMDCDGVMIGIQGGQAVCATMGFISGAANTCGAGTYAVGFNAAGQVICN